MPSSTFLGAQDNIASWISLHDTGLAKRPATTRSLPQCLHGSGQLNLIFRQLVHFEVGFHSAQAI